eukprot:11091453-Alexandrium_andersonii.AAC.1
MRPEYAAFAIAMDTWRFRPSNDGSKGSTLCPRLASCQGVPPPRNSPRRPALSVAPIPHVKAG